MKETEDRMPNVIESLTNDQPAAKPEPSKEGRIVQLQFIAPDLPEDYKNDPKNKWNARVTSSKTGKAFKDEFTTVEMLGRIAAMMSDAIENDNGFTIRVENAATKKEVVIKIPAGLEIKE